MAITFAHLNVGPHTACNSWGHGDKGVSALPHRDDITPGPRAIETVYNGYRFRSRLEARWAVFFDAVGITWDYEKEGFDLGTAGWYLPDFWLQGLNIWAEVKPDPAAWTKASVDKAAELARQSEHHVAALAGLPGSDAFYLLSPAADRPFGVQAVLVSWADCQICGGISLCRVDRPNRIESAIERAKGARFEFGESGG